MSVSEKFTLGNLVAENYKTAEVFEKYGMDFCCKGYKTIDEACSEKGIDSGLLLKELEDVLKTSESEDKTFNNLSLKDLITYIIDTHHSYVKRVMPVIQAHVQKISKVHGGNHPELKEVEFLFNKISGDFTAHLQKEELVLFPYIIAMERAFAEGVTPPKSVFGTVKNPIKMMEFEHETAGEETERIKELTQHFTPPADGCTTYRVTLQELNEFVRDLHKHVHLENTILHPKAIELEKKFVSK